jgi:hypothetical protein
MQVEVEVDQTLHQVELVELVVEEQVDLVQIMELQEQLILAVVVEELGIQEIEQVDQVAQE